MTAALGSILVYSGGNLAWKVVSTLLPTRSVQALASVEIDIGNIPEGKQKNLLTLNPKINDKVKLVFSNGEVSQSSLLIVLQKILAVKQALMLVPFVTKKLMLTVAPTLSGWLSSVSAPIWVVFQLPTLVRIYPSWRAKFKIQAQTI